MPPKPDEKEFPGLAKTEVDENLFPSEENHGDEVEEEESLLAKEAERLYDDDKVDQAAKILRSLEDHLLEEKHHAMVMRANEAEELVKNLTASPDDGDWHDNGIISQGKFPTRILHRLEQGEKLLQLRARCETPIKKDFLEPLLSVLNETQLYKTWLPSFKVPRFEIRECEKLKQAGKLTQIVFVIMDLPWPMAPREMALHAAAFDNIDEKGQIGIKLKTISSEDDEVVPELDPKNARVDLDGGFLFEKCPKDHPCMEFMEKDSDGEEMMLVTFSTVINPNLKYLPQSFLNFLVKTALGTAWKMLLQVAKDVKDGKRPDHKSAIERKREELYDYVNTRLDVMLSALDVVTTIIA
jgi:hypothetical protein